MKKIIISLSVVLILLAIAASVYYFKFYDKKEVLDNTQLQVPNVKVTEISEIYNYLYNNSSDLKVTYKFLETTNSIQVTFEDIESDDLKNMFIILDAENNQIHIKNINDNLHASGYNSYSMIPLTVYNTEMKDLSLEIIKSLTDYQNEIPKDEGDAKHYGEDVDVTQKPDGSIGIDLKEQPIVE